MNWFTLTKLDAVEALRRLPDESVDLGITDPAYESLEKHRSKGTTTRLKHSAASSNDWFAIFKNDRYPEFFAEFYRVLAKNAHLYVYCDLDTAKVIDPIGQAAGFTHWNWITWDKRKMGMGYHFRRRKEFIVFFEKGKRRLADLGISDVLDGYGFVRSDDGMSADERADRGIDTISVGRVDGGYPTEKPVAVSELLIRQSAVAGGIVCDPFMGSGSVGVAAAQCGCNFIGNDVADASHAYARPRLIAEGMNELERPTFAVGVQASLL